MSTKKANEQRWTKQEFISLVDPCNKYRFRVWWFFLWHRRATLLNVLNAWFVSSESKCYTVRRLDWRFYVSNVEICTTERAAVRNLIRNLKRALLDEK